MGLLDEAIREHLELKRKHGASDADLRDQEQQALGPARREPVPAPEPQAEPAAAQEAPAEPVAPAPEADPAVADPPPAHEVAQAPVEEPPAEPEPDNDAEWSEPDAGDGPEPQVAAPADEAGAAADEDVLEDTPDFLQETPEHDRLWFEQKPPRDFDFDE